MTQSLQKSKGLHLEAATGRTTESPGCSTLSKHHLKMPLGTSPWSYTKNTMCWSKWAVKVSNIVRFRAEKCANRREIALKSDHVAAFGSVSATYRKSLFFRGIVKIPKRPRWVPRSPNTYFCRVAQKTPNSFQVMRIGSAVILSHLYDHFEPQRTLRSFFDEL